MAVITRWFSTAAAGAGDGTSWANRAELLPSGNWSSVITGFAFNGSDSLKCLIGPGTHACSQGLASGLFTNPPTVANPLVMAGCDSSGVLLEIPDPMWPSCAPEWDTSGLPVITATTNFSIVALASTFLLLLKFTSSGRTSGAVVASVTSVNWCYVENSTTSGTAAAQVCSASSHNSILKFTGPAYGLVGGASQYFNCRIQGVTGTTGNRAGIVVSGSQDLELIQCTVLGCAGPGVWSNSTNTNGTLSIRSCVIANNGGSGVLGNPTASQVDYHTVRHCMVTGNGGYGIEAQSAAVFAFQNRLRDNTSGNFNGMGNYPTDMNNETTDAADADDYVDAAGGDFRIKYGSAIWGKGFGVADAPPTAAEIAAAVWARGERTLTE